MLFKFFTSSIQVGKAWIRDSNQVFTGTYLYFESQPQTYLDQSLVSHIERVNKSGVWMKNKQYPIPLEGEIHQMV